MVGKTCNLTTSCPLNLEFDIQHSISCKKVGFIFIRPLIRHNNLRELTANMMSEVCKDTEIEPKQGRTSNNSNESANGSSGRECQKFYSNLAQYPKRKTFRSRFQVIGFEQKFALGC